MIGFLLRVIVLSLIMFGIFSIDFVITVVTLGGQIMGAVIIGLCSVIFQLFSRTLTNRYFRQNVIATFCIMLLIAVLANNLPGYTIKNIYFFCLSIAVFAGCSILSEKYLGN